MKTHLARYLAVGWVVWMITSVLSTVGTMSEATTFSGGDAFTVILILLSAFVIGWVAAKETTFKRYE